ncbi:MAG: hypothetical protein ACRYGM_22815 [Janthinobacterium lividum]
MHDWVLADEGMAKVLADKGYHYQFVFARNAKHVDRPTVAQTLPPALEWLSDPVTAGWLLISVENRRCLTAHPIHRSRALG